MLSVKRKEREGRRHDSAEHQPDTESEERAQEKSQRERRKGGQRGTKLLKDKLSVFMSLTAQ